MRFSSVRNAGAALVAFAVMAALTGCPVTDSKSPSDGKVDSSFFWGKWSRLDAQETWYFSDVGVSGCAAGTGIPDYEANAVSVTFPDAVITVNSGSTDEKAFRTIRLFKESETSLTFRYTALDEQKREITFTLLLIRDGGKQSTFSGTALKPTAIQTESSRGLRALNLGGAGGIKLTIQNLKNQSDTQDVLTSSDPSTLGDFDSGLFIPGDPYEISGTSLSVPVVVFPDDAGGDIGAVSQVSDDIRYSLKADLHVEGSVPTNICPTHLVVNPGTLTAHEEILYRTRLYEKAWLLVRNMGDAAMQNKNLTITVEPVAGITLSAGNSAEASTTSYGIFPSPRLLPQGDGSLRTTERLYLEPFDATIPENDDEDDYNDGQTAYCLFGFTCTENFETEYKDYSLPVTLSDENGNVWRDRIQVRSYREALEIPMYLVDVTAVITSPERRAFSLRARSGSLGGVTYGTGFLIELPVRQAGYDVDLTPNFEPSAAIQFAAARVVYRFGSNDTVTGTQANQINSAADTYESGNDTAAGAIEWRPGDAAIDSKIRPYAGDRADWFRVYPAD